jgi:hypothetical protein
MHATGYPAPRYEGTGQFDDSCWSLQERLPGEIPDVLQLCHAEQLLAFAARHADMAGRSVEWIEPSLARHGKIATRLASDSRTEGLGLELAEVLGRAALVPVRTGDVCHQDFHHRNFLAQGERVTGVFDWEQASPGDWRSDVFTLAFWSVLVKEQYELAAGELIRQRMFEVVPAPFRRLLAAMKTAELLDFQLRHHPDRIESTRANLVAEVRLWWQDG